MIARHIEGWAQDEDGDPVAYLDCGHRRHVRHRPPLSNYAWVDDPARRRDHIGTSIECGRCEQLELPADAEPYKSTAVFDASTLPAGLQRAHTTKHGVWARIEVLAGAVDYVVPVLDRRDRLEPGTPGIVAPQVEHHLELVGPVRLQVTFLRVPAPPNV